MATQGRSIKPCNVVSKLCGTATLTLVVSTAICVLVAACSPPTDSNVDTAPVIGTATRVSLQYTIRLDDGSEVATNVGADPLELTIGQAEIFPALEAILDGLTIGDERSISLTPEQAYGPRDDEAVREIELSMVPEESRLVGAVLLAEDGEGGQREVTVREIDGETVVILFIL